MCGIHLLWGKAANEENMEILLQRGRSRGPDQEAVLSPWPGIWIGVNRLRISDLSPKSDQPFWTPDRHAFLIWNGELYNSPELRSLLTTMGMKFKTESDTEVLLLWLRSFGEKGIAKLKGMFAFILVDVVNKSILVARDPNGEKPLFFKQDQDTLCVSSTASGIARVMHAAVERRVFCNYSFFRAPLQGNSFFTGVKEWKPNRYSLIKNHLAFRFDLLPAAKSKEENLDRSTFEAHLKKAVERQFRADAPVGLLLSGGADSSLLYALWAKMGGENLPCFTLALEEKYQSKYQDPKYSHILADKFGFELKPILVTQEVFLEHWEAYVAQLDQPVGDSAGFLLWILGAKAKAEGIQVLISGAGADELWGGYRRHAAFEKYLTKKSWLLWLALFIQKLPLPREYGKFFRSLRRNENHTFLNFSALRPVDKEIFLDVERFFDPKLPAYKRALDFDRKVYLVEDLLKIQDQSLMAHGVEGRSPYLDTDLVAFWKKIEDPEVLSGKKWIYELLQKYGLSEISERPKLGFGLPLLEWLQEDGPVAKRVFDLVRQFGLNYTSDLPAEIAKICRQPQDYVKSDFLILYNLFLLAEWMNLRES